MSEPGEVSYLAIAIRDKLMDAIWVNRMPQDMFGEVCLSTATAQVVRRLAENPLVSYPTIAFQDRKVFDLMVDEAQKRGCQDTIAFNDAPGRTFEEIMDFMDAVIRRAKELYG